MRFALRFCSALLILAAAATATDSVAQECRYRTWEWNTLGQRAENHREVRKPMAELTAEERDSQSPCTVCESDQVWVRKEGLPPFRICRHYRQAIEEALAAVVDAGFPVVSITGYRVGRSKGAPDENGLRTRFSHHSFGTAIDINADRNGLYTDCVEFDGNCRLLRGGPWFPEQPGAITLESVVYEAFRNIGWKWGGELAGRQKDFMHFSLAGD